MTRHNQRIGKWGEDVAAAWLVEHGSKLLGRNIRTPYGEIDILVERSGVIVFVEVKALTSSRHFLPEQQITSRKREHMLHAAQHYAAEHGIDRWQIDVIAVEGSPEKGHVVTHFENAL